MKEEEGKVMSMLQLSLIAGSGVELNGDGVRPGLAAQEVVQNQAKRNCLALPAAVALEKC